VKFSLRKLFIPALAVIAIVAAAVVFWPKKTSDLDPKRVAVAIFENQTGDPKLDPIGRLAAELITQGLSQMSDFTVAPLSASETPTIGKTEKSRLQLIAEETKAGKVVTGTYHLQGDSISFHAKVMDLAADKILIDLEPTNGPLQDPAKAIEPIRVKLMGGLAYVFDPVLKDFSAFMGVAPTYESSREYIDGCKDFVRMDYQKAIDHCLLAAKFDPDFKLPLLYAAVAYIKILKGEKKEKSQAGNK
jgi:TolB-like protein